MTETIVVKIGAPQAVQVARVAPTIAQVIIVKNAQNTPTPAEIGVYTTAQVDGLLKTEDAKIVTATVNFSTPATMWSIDHNLNRSFPDVKIFDTAGEEIHTDIQFVNSNTVVATFAAPTAGVAFIS
jgi:hypothetical protein